MANFTDEELMAFADGELDASRTAAIRAVLVTRPDIAARVDVFGRSRRIVKDAAAQQFKAALPPALKTRVEQMIADAGDRATTLPPAENAAMPNDNVVAISARRSAQAERGRSSWITAIAASLVAIVAGLAGYWTGASGSGASRGIAVAATVSGPLAAALSRVPSGGQEMLGDGAEISIVSSFEEGARALCREFELSVPDSSRIHAVACWRGGGWTTEMALHAAAGETGYLPASGAAAVDTYLSAIGAEAPLPAEDERQRLQALSAGNR